MSLFTHTNADLTVGQPWENNRYYNRMCAIALNNVALSLLSRGFCNEALTTCKDALTHIRYATSLIANGGCCDGISQGGNNVRLALDQATKRSIRCKQQDTQQDMSFPKLEVITTQSCPSNVVSNGIASLTSESSNVPKASLFPMMIDRVDATSCSEDDLRFEAAVVLYDYGIVYMIASKDKSLSSMDECRLLVEHAYRLFLMARAILPTMESGGCISSYEPWDISCRVLILRIVLTRNLIQCAIQLGISELNDDYVRDMQCLLHIVQVQTSILPMPDHPVAPAA